MALAASAGVRLAAAGASAGLVSSSRPRSEARCSKPSSPADGFSRSRKAESKPIVQPPSASRSASRPGLRQSQVTSEVHTVDKEEEEVAGSGSDPLPLVARAAVKGQLARKQATWHKAENVVEWFGSDRAKDMLLSLAIALPPYDWPMFRKQKRQEREADLAPPMEAPEEIELVEEAAEESPLYPRSAWPREGVSTSSRLSSPPAAPRCSWPGESSLAAPSPLPAASAPLVAGPHCNWPRQSGAPSHAPQATPLSSAATTKEEEPVSVVEQPALKRSEQTEKEIASLERMFASTPNAAGPHCAWPRRGSRAPQPEAPRCAWPRKQTPPPFLEAPRCAWPRSASSGATSLGHVAAPAASEQVAASRCAWPRPSAAPPAVEGPRCAWPKGGVAPAPALAEAGPLIMAGARCAWPRPAVGGASLGHVAAPAADGVGAARCAWPRHAPASSAAEGPRCAWPKGGAQAPVLAEVGSKPVAGAHCAWPRPSPNGASVGHVAAPAAGAHCAWPRPAPNGASAGHVAAPVAEDVSAARCAWPRHMPASVAAEGPRCSWPREAAPAPALTEGGARCAWPREGGEAEGARGQ